MRNNFNINPITNVIKILFQMAVFFSNSSLVGSTDEKVSSTVPKNWQNWKCKYYAKLAKCRQNDSFFFLKLFAKHYDWHFFLFRYNRTISSLQIEGKNVSFPHGFFFSICSQWFEHKSCAFYSKKFFTM